MVCETEVPRRGARFGALCNLALWMLTCLENDSALLVRRREVRAETQQLSQINHRSRLCHGNHQRRRANSKSHLGRSYPEVDRGAFFDEETNQSWAPAPSLHMKVCIVAADEDRQLMGCAPTPIAAAHRRVSSVLYEKSCYLKIAGAGKDLIQEAIDV